MPLLPTQIVILIDFKQNLYYFARPKTLVILEIQRSDL